MAIKICASLFVTKHASYPGAGVVKEFGQKFKSACEAAKGRRFAGCLECTERRENV